MAEAESRTVTVPLPGNGHPVGGGGEGAGGGSGGDAAPGSLLARIRMQAAAQRAARTLDLPVGREFGDRLRIRYRPLPIDDLDRFAALEMGNGGPVSDLSITMMVETCQTILYVEGDDELDLEVRFTGELWKKMGWPLPPNTGYEDLLPSEVVRALFGDNALLLTTHMGQLWKWMETGDESGEA